LIFATVPTSGSQPSTCANSYAAVYLSTAISDVQPTNLTKIQRKLLLHVHERMAHLGFDDIQHLAHSSYFGDSLRCIGNCDKPLCHACCLGKAHKRPVSTGSTPLKATHLHPGDCISTDQLESNAPGRIPVLKCVHLRNSIMPALSLPTMHLIKFILPCIALLAPMRPLLLSIDLKNWRMKIMSK
jgi:hypothetical protein